MITREQQHRKTIAALICLLLGYIYVESVFLPYFYPERYIPKEKIVESVVDKKEEIAKKEMEELSPESFSEENIKSEESIKEEPLETKNESAATESTQLSASDSSSISYYPSEAELTRAGSLQIETDKFELHLSLLGARAQNVFLKEFKETLAKDSRPHDLVSHVEGAPLPLGIYNADVNDAFTVYRQISGPEADVDGRIKISGQTELVFEGELKDGRRIKKALRFDKDSYMLGVDASLSSASPSGAPLQLEWTQFVSQKDLSGSINPYDATGYTWFDGEAASRLGFSSLENEKKDLGDVTWLSSGNKYFITALLSSEKKESAQILKTGQLFRARMSGEEKEVNLALYLGPKSYKTLLTYGFELQRSIDFGFTGIIAAPLLELLLFFETLFGNYGLAIIALTILVKLALYPLTVSQFKQMKGMQVLAPELKRIKETIKDQRQQQAAIMQLYKKKGVNPFGGCLPMLLQMPIFIGLYSALMLAVELRHAPFALWVADLSAPEKCMIAGFGIPVMVILFVLSMMVQQWITPSTADPAQKKMMLFMPVIFGFMFMNFPAGLTLYWLTNNLISIGQAQAAHRDMKKGAGVQITLGISLAIFLLAFVLTKL